MIYFIKIINLKKNESTFVSYYDLDIGELLTTDNMNERQEYLSLDSLMEDLGNILSIIDMSNNLVQVGAY